MSARGSGAVGAKALSAPLHAAAICATGSTDTAPSYEWAYNNDGDITQELSALDATSGHTWGETDNIYDDTNQLTTTTYTDFAHYPTSNVGEAYDSNGNRTTTSDLAPGTESPQSGSNRMLYDGTYYYNYDPNGNRTAKFTSTSGVLDSSASQITIYVWNAKNELVSSTYYATYEEYHTQTGGVTTTYAYDAFGRMVATDPAGGSNEYFVYDGENAALVLNADAQVTERELYGPAVDQVLATEYVTPGSEGSEQSAGTTKWALPDNELTIRDVAIYNATAHTTSIADHLVYDPFGQMTYQSTPTNQPQFTYDGMWQAPSTTGLDYDAASSTWYDAVDAVFASGGPAGDGNGVPGTNPYSRNGNNPGSPGGAAGGSIVFLLPPDGGDDIDDNNRGNARNDGGGYQLGGNGFGGYAYPPIEVENETAPPRDMSGYTPFARIVMGVGVQSSGSTGSGGGSGGTTTKPVRAQRPAVNQNATRNALLAMLQNGANQLPIPVLDAIEQRFPSLTETIYAMAGHKQQRIISVPGENGGPGIAYVYEWVDSYWGFGASYYQLKETRIEKRAGDTAAARDKEDWQTIGTEKKIADTYAVVMGSVAVLPMLLPEAGAAGGAELAGGLPEEFAGDAAVDTLVDGGVDAGADAAVDGGADAAEDDAAELLRQCFPAGTLVATPRGLFPIETLKAGDEVWAYDLLNCFWCARTVLQRYVSDHDGTSATIAVADEEIEATFLHPFWVVHGADLSDRPVREHLPRVPEGSRMPGRWVDAGDIRVGDELLLRDGRILPVQAVRHQPYNDKVYNIHVDDFQCYAVGPSSVLAHNMNGSRFSELPEASRAAVLKARDFAEASAQVWKNADKAEEAANTWALAEAISQYINDEGEIAPEVLMWIIKTFG